MTDTTNKIETRRADQLTELRQAVWDAYGILGFDQDGDTNPDASSLTRRPVSPGRRSGLLDGGWWPSVRLARDGTRRLGRA